MNDAKNDTVSTTPDDALSHEWVHVSDGRLLMARQGQGAVLLLIHGWALDWRSFAPQLDAFAKHFTVVAYDRRGFGRSSAPPDLDAELTDIDQILDHLGVERAHILGVSQGGRIALRYATTRMPRIASLTVQGAMVDGLDVRDQGNDRIPLARYARLARSNRMDELKAAWLAHPLMAFAHQPTAESQLLRRIVNDYAGRDLCRADAATAVAPVKPLEGLARLQAPVLVISGAHETSARRAHARAVCDATDRAREVLLPDCGHLPNLESVDEFNATVLAFCREAQSAGTRQ